MELVTQPTSHARRSINTLLFLLILLAGGAAHAQVSVTATSGTTGPSSYTTLKSAFDAINLGTHHGAVTITINASTTETATAALNASGTGSSSYTSVLIQPGASATPSISGPIAGAPLITLNGASNVKIDGSNNGSNSRDLTISNTSTTTPQVLLIGSVGTTPITNDTVSNCTLLNGVNTSSALLVSDVATPGNPGYFNNIGIINNSLQKAYIGMYLNAVVTGTNGSGTFISKNSLNSSGPNAMRLVAVYVQGVSGGRVDSNVIGNFDGTNAEFDRGIWFATGTNNSSITGNTVTGMGYTGATAGYAPIGINVSPGVTSSNISVTGNTVTGLSSISTGTTMGIYFYSAASGVIIEKNRVSNIKNSNTGGAGAAGIMLAGTLAASAVNVLNNFVWDVAAYGTNAWTSGSNGNGIVADAGGGYNIYYNSVWLNTNQTATTGTRAAAVLITTNVTATNSINLRNNLLINTQTVGNGNSRMALVITANTNVMNTFNYNDYYATSGNLAGQGTNATIWNNISQIQTNMGNNGNSVSILPVFTSSTDLHLPVASNASLNNIGVSIATITNDIDGDPRTSTPDMGADEFGNCQTVTITGQPTTSAFCAGGNTSLTVAATNGNTVQWQVNTGAGFTNVANGGVYSGATTSTLNITAAPAGMNGFSYRAQVSSGPSCPQTASNAATLIVNPRPSVAVTSSGPTSFCTGGSDVLSIPATTNAIYQWYESGTTLSATGTSYTATTGGSYSVIATNTVTGCADTSVVTLIAVGTGPAAAITPFGANFICQGKSLNLSAGTTPGVTYQWQLNGNPISGATSNTLSASAAGNYSVVVSSSPTCSSTSTASIVSVYPLPSATATIHSGAAAICQGSTATLSANAGANLSYQWLSNNTIIAGATNGSYVANTASSYRVVVTNTFTTCRDTSTAIAIAMNPLPTATISPTAPPAICERDTSLFTANTGAKLNYQWQLNGGGISGAAASQYKAYRSGSYSVLITDSNGCQKTSPAVPLLVHPAPIATITYSSPLEFCEGSAVALNALQSPAVTYQWINNGTDMPGIIAPTQVIALSGVYSVRVQDAFNCTSLSEEVRVTVFPAPVPVITRNGGTLSTGNYTTYQWFLNNKPISSGNADSYVMTEDGAYKVMVEDGNGCTGISDLFIVMNVSVGNAALAAQIDVYPNPATEFITIENKSNTKLKSATIINSIGAIVQQAELGTAGLKDRILLSGVPAGVYYLRLESSNGAVLLKKMVVAR